MYRAKEYRVRDLDESLEDIRMAKEAAGNRITKLFVADGDALGMPMAHWLPILDLAKKSFPRLKRVSCYAMTENILEKTPEELSTLRKHGLSILYIGPESGDDPTLISPSSIKTITKH